MRSTKLYSAASTRVLCGEYSNTCRKVRRRAPHGIPEHRAQTDRAQSTPTAPTPEPFHKEDHKALTRNSLYLFFAERTRLAMKRNNPSALHHTNRQNHKNQEMNQFGPAYPFLPNIFIRIFASNKEKTGAVRNISLKSLRIILAIPIFGRTKKE